MRSGRAQIPGDLFKSEALEALRGSSSGGENRSLPTVLINRARFGALGLSLGQPTVASFGPPLKLANIRGNK